MSLFCSGCRLCRSPEIAIAVQFKSHSIDNDTEGETEIRASGAPHVFTAGKRRFFCVCLFRHHRSGQRNCHDQKQQHNHWGFSVHDVLSNDGGGEVFGRAALAGPAARRGGVIVPDRHNNRQRVAPHTLPMT